MGGQSDERDEGGITKRDAWRAMHGRLEVEGQAGGRGRLEAWRRTATGSGGDDGRDGDCADRAAEENGDGGCWTAESGARG